MEKQRDIDWVAPALMLGSLATGILFAIGHHLFYQNLNEKIASESVILGSITYQQANIATGTALAFIVKSFLVFAVAAAFVQVFWNASSKHQAASSITMKQLDILYSGLSNAFAFAYVLVWRQYLILLGLAMIAWLIPVASIITPATLSIHSAPFDVVASTKVPNLDFASFNFVANMQGSDAGEFSYSGPRTDVLTIVNSVLSGGSIVPIDPPGANSSWALDFPGPSLRCHAVNETTQRRFVNNFEDANVQYDFSGRYCHASGYAYYGWCPRYSSNGPTDLPFIGLRNGSLQFSPGSLMKKHSRDAIAAPAFYMMTIPGLLSVGDWFGCNDTAKSYPGTMVQCNLFNSTYHVLFNYTEGTQRISTEILHVDTEPQDAIVWGMAIPDYDPYENMVRCPDLQTPHMYHSYSRGGLPVHHALYRGYERKVRKSEDCGTFNRELLQKLSYQAIFDAFTSALKGVAPVDSTSQGWPSNVLETRLTRTNELDFLVKRTGAEGGDFLQHQVQDLNDPNIMGLMNREDETTDQPLSQVLEKLFERATISLMSSPRLRLNYSSNFAPAPPNVTHHKYHNVYTYSAWKLWTAYGIAILFATISVLVGLETVLSTGVSYSDNFSTIFRIARGAEVSKPILDNDLDGKDPLPDYMSSSEVYFYLQQRRAGAYQAVKNCGVDK